MAKRIEAIVDPQLLIWARESSGLPLDLAAKRIGIRPEKLERIENREERLTIPQLRKAANAYKRPLAAFYLPKPPDMPPSVHDFRSHDRASPRVMSPELLIEVRNAYAKREDALHLAEDLDEVIPKFRHAKPINDPKGVGKTIRRMLSVPVEQQKSWKDSAQALKAWKKAVEALGVLVLETSKVALSEIRGLSISAAHLPVILLNGKDSHNGRIFTLFHEFAHLLLNFGGVCDPFETPNKNTEDGKTEIFCNRAGGAALVPAEKLITSLPNMERPTGWTHEILGQLSKEFSVSKEVILRRLLILNRTTPQYYAKMREEFLEEYAGLENKKQSKKSAGGPRQEVLVARNLGAPFIKLVLEAYAQEKITASDVSDYLGIKLNYLGDIERIVYRGEAW